MAETTPTDGAPPGGDRPASRLEAFSDGVFAIAATLLVIEIHPPDPASPNPVGDLLRLWPSFAAYAVSFLTIGIVWVNHHALVAGLRAVDRTLLFLNLLLLMLIGLIPFPTALLADAIGHGAGERVAGVAYGLTMLAMGGAFSVLLSYAAGSPALSGLPPGAASARIRRSWAEPPMYAVATLVALASPPLALVAFAAVALWFVVPSRRPGPAA